MRRRGWTVLFLLSFCFPSSGAAQTIAAGAQHTLLRMADGSIVAWGADGFGQLGDNTTATLRTPQAVPGLSGVIAVAAGQFHSVALTSGGAVKTWGRNNNGQLGDGSTTDRWQPVTVSITGVVAIAAGDWFTLAMKSDGSVYAWGLNTNGQLGDGSTTQRTSPVLISGLTATAIAAGASHGLAVGTDGKVRAWGSNSNGQLGDSTTTQRTSPTLMSGTITTATAVAAGRFSSYVRLSDGTLRATGANSNGELGDGTTTQRTALVTVSGVSSVNQLTAGYGHAIALTTSGALWTWGNNPSGELGDGTTTARPTPAAMTNPTSIARIGAGTQHSLAVDSDGVVWTWGDNVGSDLGDGTTVVRRVPIAISTSSYTWKSPTPTFNPNGGAQTTAQNVVVGNYDAQSVVHYTLDGSDPSTSDPTVDVGTAVTVSQSATLKARAYLGAKPPSNVATAAFVLQPVTPTCSPNGGSFTAPVSVTLATTTSGATIHYTSDGSTPTESSSTYSSAVTVSAGSTLKAIATKATWDASSVGSCTFTFNYGPAPAPTFSPTAGTYEGATTVTISAIAGGTIRYTTNGSDPTSSSTVYTQPLVLAATTTLKAKVFHPDYTASSTTSGTYTIRVPTPQLTRSTGSYAPGDVVTITSPDSGATLRVTLTGTDPTTSDLVVSSGTVFFLGNYTLKVRATKSGLTDSNVASATYTLTDPLGTGSASAGGSHTAVARPDGVLYAWGQNTSGQVGDGSTTNRLVPTLLQSLTGVLSVSAGGSHTLALTLDGQVYAWGNNGSGRIGDGTTTSRSRPTLVSTLSSIAAVAAGGSHSLALTADGHVYAWGLGSSGQLGLGDMNSQSLPTLVTGVSNVVAIAAGANHSVAVTESGQLYTWGANSASQLGDGTTTARSSPTLISGVSQVVGVAAGGSHTLARVQSGAVYVWGAGTNGQLGLGSTTSKTTPTLLTGITVVDLFAGSAHSMAFKTDGTLAAWGLNSNGQVGDTTTTQRTSPVAVQGPSAVGLADAGDTHGVIITPDGHVWTWGAGAAGQLGDNTTTATRSTPQDVATLPGSWGSVPAPTLNLTAGVYHDTQSVVVSEGLTTATIHYTTTGVTPTESDPTVASGGTIPVDGTMTLQVRAFASGLVPSRVVSAAYTLQPVTPTVTPTGGPFSSAQSVTLATSTSGTTLHYTLDGTDPTAASLTYSGALPIASSATVKVRAFRTAWTASDVGSGTLSFNLGQLAAPIATPASGTYASGQAIGLSAPSGATIRYTTDGSTPTVQSTVYGGPITLLGSLNLQAKAFAQDWMPSETLSATYDTDATPPTISAVVSPAANLAGWNETDVTVTFVCHDNVGVASCSPQSSVSSEGEGNTVFGEAQDVAGLTANRTVTINIDKTSPEVELGSYSSTTTASSITIQGAAADVLSGVGTVSCNGIVASIDQDGGFTCNVSLQPGNNIVLITANDRAGNSASQVAQVNRSVNPSGLRITPGEVTLVQGTSRKLAVVDDLGVVHQDASWQSSDDGIAVLSAADGETIEAVAVGTATISATLAGMTATATVHVLAAAPTAASFEAWRYSAPNNSGAGSVIAQQTDSSSPALFTLERVADTAVTIHGLTSTGIELGSTSMTLNAMDSAELVMGDVFGGALGEIGAHTIFRSGGSAAAWAYHSAGYLGAPIQAPDGTVYVQESPDPENSADSWLLGLNGETGAIKFRVTLPPGYLRTIPDCPGIYTGVSWASAVFIKPIVLLDGSAALVGQSRRENFVPCYDYHNLEGSFESSTWSMVVGSAGLASSQTLAAFTSSQLYEVPPGWTDITVGPLLPHPDGGFVAPVLRTDAMGATQGSIVRVSSGSSTEWAASFGAGDFPSAGLVDFSGVLYLSSSQGSTAFDLRNGIQLWNASMGGAPLTTLIGGGVGIMSTNGTLDSIDALGGVTTGPTVNAWGRVTPWQPGVWIESNGASIVAHRGAPVADGDFLYRTAGGNAQGQGAAGVPGIATFVPPPYLGGAGTGTSSAFVGSLGQLLGRRAAPQMYVTASATLAKFFDVTGADFDGGVYAPISASRLDAVAFIGHSIEKPETTPPEPPSSVGLCFAESDLIKMNGIEPLDPTQQWFYPAIPGHDFCPGHGAGTAFRVNTVAMRPRIVFLASCYPAELLQSLWGIDNQTAGRALIVPTNDNSPVFLNNGADAWAMIADRLSRGDSAAQAVQYANDRSSQHDHLEFKIIGLGAGADVYISGKR